MGKSAYLHCIYAEDARQELSGQISIIGIFQGGLRVPTVPAQIPKLVIIANLFIPEKKPPVSVKLEVYRDNEILQTIEPPADFLQTVQEKAEASTDDGIGIQFLIGFAGFPIPSPGKLAVRVTFDGTSLDGNTLQISVGDVQQVAQTQTLTESKLH